MNVSNELLFALASLRVGRTIHGGTDCILTFAVQNQANCTTLTHE
jgi:hypothetical protein